MHNLVWVACPFIAVGFCIFFYVACYGIASLVADDKNSQEAVLKLALVGLVPLVIDFVFVGLSYL